MLDELIADHSQPNLPQSTKSMLSEGLLFAIIKYGQHNIFGLLTIVLSFLLRVIALEKVMDKLF